jgi:ribonuclease T2
MRLLAATAALLFAIRADAQEPGAFDYYLLALSWSPSWCETTGDDRDAAECDPGTGFGFTLHGLWPQFENGWPEWCSATARDPSRMETAAMADIMGSAGLAWHQWKKHGRCSGLDPEAYFALAREALGSVEMPAPDPGRITAAELEASFLSLNDDMRPEGILATCREGLVSEVRICLDRDLAPRDCGPDVLDRACRADRDLILPPPR